MPIADTLRSITATLNDEEAADLQRFCDRVGRDFEAEIKNRLWGKCRDALRSDHRLAESGFDRKAMSLTLSELPTVDRVMHHGADLGDLMRTISGDTEVAIVDAQGRSYPFKAVADGNRLEFHPAIEASNGKTPSAPRPGSEELKKGDAAVHAGLEGGDVAVPQGGDGEKPKRGRRARAG